MDQDPFEAGAVKLLNKETPHGPNTVARFSEGSSPTDISPRAIGTTTPLALVRFCLSAEEHGTLSIIPHTMLAASAIWP